MSVLTPKIRKLQRALEMRGELYLVNRAQIYSETLDKVCTKYILDKAISWDEWRSKNPTKKKHKCKRVRENVLESFKELDILLALADAYRKGGERDG